MSSPWFWRLDMTVSRELARAGRLCQRVLAAIVLRLDRFDRWRNR